VVVCVCHGAPVTVVRSGDRGPYAQSDADRLPPRWAPGPTACLSYTIASAHKSPELDVGAIFIAALPESTGPLVPGHWLPGPSEWFKKEARGINFNLRC
jgi:hypothetical protein